VRRQRADKCATTKTRRQLRVDNCAQTDYCAHPWLWNTDYLSQVLLRTPVLCYDCWFLNVAKATGFTKDIDIVVTDVMRIVHHLGGACVVIV